MNVLLFHLCLAALLLGFFSPEQHPVPPGVRQAEQTEIRAEQNIPPPSARAARDPLQLQREAQEIAELAASIPAAVENARRGVLAKDTPEKLKRIEKLSKRLRADLAHY